VCAHFPAYLSALMLRIMYKLCCVLLLRIMYKM
jgi:hypothetical protein